MVTEVDVDTALVVIVGYRQILLPIAIEVAHAYGCGTGAHRKAEWRLEGPISVPGQYGNGVVSVVSDRQIRFPVAIEDGHVRRIVAHCEVLCRLEGPIAVTQ